MQLHREHWSCRGRSGASRRGSDGQCSRPARAASREEGAQNVQVDLGKLLELLELDMLVQLVDAQVDRADLDDLGTDVDDEARVRRAAGGLELAVVAGVLVRRFLNDLGQPSLAAQERLRAERPGDAVVERVLPENGLDPRLEG